MKTEIRKILADKTETLEDGRVVIVPDFSQLDDLVDDLDTLFSLHVVGKCNELLKAKKEPIVKGLRNNLTKANDEYSDGKMTDAIWLRHTGFLKGKISALLNLSL